MLHHDGRPPLGGGRPASGGRVARVYTRGRKPMGPAAAEDPPAAPARPAIPDEFDPAAGIGRWRCMGLLGEGGLARVYRAEDVSGCLGEVALKVLRANAKPVHAFELHREAQWSMAYLHNMRERRYNERASRRFVRYLEDHTGFAPQGPPSPSYDLRARRRSRFEARDFDWDAYSHRPRHRPYAVMELLEGETLYAITSGDRRSALPLVERYAILAELALACSYLEAFGLIHRDLRSCNIQISKRGGAQASEVGVKVLDLGVAIAAERELQRSSNAAVRVFEPGRVAGACYDWLPWEARAGDANFLWPAHSFDAFSLGVLWLQLVAGRQAARDALGRLAAGQAWGAEVDRLGCRELVAAEGAAEGGRPASAAVAAADTLRRLLGPAEGRPRPSEVGAALEALLALHGGRPHGGPAPVVGGGGGGGPSTPPARRSRKRAREEASSAGGPPLPGSGSEEKKVREAQCADDSHVRMVKEKASDDVALAALARAEDDLARMRSEVSLVIQLLNQESGRLTSTQTAVHARAAAALAAVERCQAAAAGVAASAELPAAAPPPGG